MTDWTHLQDIRGSLSDCLRDKMVGVAVCGSIAAIEVHRIARILMRHGAKVQFFLTEAAARLVSATSLAWCTGRPVVESIGARCEHLEYFGKGGLADLLLVAPATANTLGKIAHGLDDNVVTTCVTTALGEGIPVLCAPGMHEPMMRNRAVLRNLEQIRGDGVEVLEPILAEGKQKMMAAEEIVARVLRRLGPGDLAGKRVLLTGGPTREFLDPARCLTNPSSGLTACLLSEEAYRRGAEVTLIYGPGSVGPPPWIRTERVISTEDMASGVRARLEEVEYDYVVAAAAVCDFQPAVRSDSKMPTARGALELRLEPTPKVIRVARETAPGATLVAFKAASSRSDQELRAAAEPYLREGRADLVVGNSIVEDGMGFEAPRNRYLVCRPGGDPTVLGPESKENLSRLLWDEILRP